MFEIEQGNFMTILLIIMFVGVLATIWAYNFMKRRQEKVIDDALNDLTEELADHTKATQKFTREASEIATAMLEYIVASLNYFAAEHDDSPEEDGAFLGLSLAMERLSPGILNEARELLPVDSVSQIEKMMGKSWEKLVWDAEHKPSSEGHETVGGDEDYFS